MLADIRGSGPVGSLRSPLRIAIVMAIFFVMMLLMLSRTTTVYPGISRTHPPPPPSSSSPPSEATHELPAPAKPSTPQRGAIPNIVHFVYILKDAESDFNFEFKQFLSVYAAWHYWKPETVFLHTNAVQGGRAIQRALNGTSGKWTQHIFTRFNIQINTVPLPTHTDFGKEIKDMEHKSDFVRVKAVHEHGGTYIDFDVHALRDTKFLRESGFKGIAGRQMGGQLNSGTFMSAPGGRMAKLWMTRMHDAYTGDWTSHSNGVLTYVGERLVREPGEMLIMEREAFAPGSWEGDDNEKLFAVHSDTMSNLESVGENGALPSHVEGFYDRWEHAGRFPGWERDYSSTYLLHAFSPGRYNRKVTGFDHITPKYVLARQSNFARAVYPIAKLAYDEGLIQMDDSHLGIAPPSEKPKEELKDAAKGEGDVKGEPTPEER